MTGFRRFTINRGAALAALALPLALAACGKNDDGNLASLDAQLTNNATDPAARAALEGNLATDPGLSDKSNAHAVKGADRPASGAAPLVRGGPVPPGAIEARTGGSMLSAPQAVKTEDGGLPPMTLGAIAREQGQQQKRRGDCGKLQYGMEWAGRMPAPFTAYPGANLVDAAGSQGPDCAIHAVSFVAGAPMQSVIDFYYTVARRANYDGEHLILNGDHVLGGVNGDGAYFITFKPAPAGGTAVDIVTNQGA